jgi:cGMP-dependent protein kinase 1
MTTGQKDAIANHLILEKFKPGETIVNEGDMASSYYIIKEGEVEVQKNGLTVRKLKAGDSFGENALSEEGIRQMSIISLKETVCIGLSKENLVRVFGDKIQEVVIFNFARWGFENNKVLGELTRVQIEKQMSIMKRVQVKEGEIIYKPGDTFKDLICVIDAGVKVTEKNGQNELSKGILWGEKYLENDKPNQK